MLVIIAGGGWLVWYSGWLNTLMGPKTATTTPVTPVATTTQPAPVQQPPMDMNGMSDAKDAGDTALQQDTTAIDTQLQGLTTDSANLDSAIADKPISQN